MNDKIIPFTYNVKADKKRAYPLFFTVLTVSAAFVMLSMIVGKYSGVVSLCAVVGLTAAVLIYQRYITSDYSYVIGNGGDDSAILLVTKRLGNRVSTMANLPLYSVLSIQKFTKEELKKHKTDKTVRKYNFAPTYSPDVIYLVSARTSDASFEVILECIPDVADRILEYSSYAKADELTKRADEGSEDL